MSKGATATTSPMAQPASTPMTSAIPRERIAMRAYERWLKGGCKHGNDRQDWIEAEKELRVEMGKNQGAQTRR
jgi:hypothetical protein